MITVKNKIMVEDILKYLNIICIGLRKEHQIYREKALFLLETIINKLKGAQKEFSLYTGKNNDIFYFGKNVYK